MLQSLCNSTTNVKVYPNGTQVATCTIMIKKKNQNGTQQVTSTCNCTMQKNVCQKSDQNCTQQVTSACTMRQNLQKKGTRMVQNRLHLPVTVLCSKISNKKYQNGTKRQFKLKILS